MSETKHARSRNRFWRYVPVSCFSFKTFGKTVFVSHLRAGHVIYAQAVRFGGNVFNQYECLPEIFIDKQVSEVLLCAQAPQFCGNMYGCCKRL